ncbi:MAG: (d)CMP kinase [Candidatus Electrothrix sp. GW3-4]|uniref:(d)CMP kinase n=1 Tax=Candidatus Electrothrix sp. GW3-4 TaxID=3126740 RepID=UPI0030CF5649
MSEQMPEQGTNAAPDKLRVVTIDGPSGVGKSTVSRRVAAELGFTYLDTGAMYRAVGYACAQAGIEVDDPAHQEALNKLLAELDLRLLPPEKEGDEVRVFLGDEEVSAAIRMPEMSMAASQVSAVPTVRARLTVMQQEMGKAGGLVADGRDTGTVVFPQAAWKFYLDASPEERCRRRVAQLRERGQEVDEQETLAQIIERDRNDQERTIAPLVMAADALHIDSSHINADEVVARMLEVVSSG